jgi:glycosyltransferase involved in cell wall biosynthesis
VEALAIGLPAILTEVPGLVDLRAHFPGLVYAEPNAQGLAAALAAGLSMTKAQRERLSKEYRRTASKHYSADRGVNEYGAVYASVLGRKARQESVST